MISPFSAITLLLCALALLTLSVPSVHASELHNPSPAPHRRAKSTTSAYSADSTDSKYGFNATYSWSAATGSALGTAVPGNNNCTYYDDCDSSPAVVNAVVAGSAVGLAGLLIGAHIIAPAFWGWLWNFVVSTPHEMFSIPVQAGRARLVLRLRQ